MKDWITLDGLKRGQDAAFALLRLYLGGFLIWGVWDNIVSPERMAEFPGFLAGLDCPWPAGRAGVGVGAAPDGGAADPGPADPLGRAAAGGEFPGGGAAARGVGRQDARELFGPMMCVLAGLILATYGPGRVVRTSGSGALIGPRAPSRR